MTLISRYVRGGLGEVRGLYFWTQNCSIFRMYFDMVKIQTPLANHRISIISSGSALLLWGKERMQIKYADFFGGANQSMKAVSCKVNNPGDIYIWVFPKIMVSPNHPF